MPSPTPRLPALAGQKVQVGMQMWLPGLVVGILLVVSALLMLWSHVRTWQSRRSDPEIDEADRSFWYRQYVRRMQASGLMLLIGLLIPLGDSLIPWRKAPALFAIYWMFVLALVGWVILLAVSDLGCDASPLAGGPGADSAAAAGTRAGSRQTPLGTQRRTGRRRLIHGRRQFQMTRRSDIVKTPA